jgi:hypothetical protein
MAWDTAAALQGYLDSLSQVPGSILVRGDPEWYALPPGTPGHVLALDDLGSPFWTEAPTGEPTGPAVTPIDGWTDIGPIASTIDGTTITLEGNSTSTEAANATATPHLDLSPLASIGGKVEIEFRREIAKPWWDTDFSDAFFNAYWFPGVTDPAQIGTETAAWAYAQPHRDPTTPYCLGASFVYPKQSNIEFFDSTLGNTAEWENRASLSSPNAGNDLEETGPVIISLILSRLAADQIRLQHMISGVLRHQNDLTSPEIETASWTESLFGFHFHNFGKAGNVTITNPRVIA